MACAFTCCLIMVGIQVNSIANDRWKNPDQQKLDIINSIVMLITVAGSVIAMAVPKSTTPMVLIVRLFMSVFLCMSMTWRFEGKNMCDEPAKIQIKYFKTIVTTRTVIDNLFVAMSIFVTPFCDRFLLTFIFSSFYFAVEHTMIQKYYSQSEKTMKEGSLTNVLTGCLVMFILTYFIRRTLT